MVKSSLLALLLVSHPLSATIFHRIDTTTPLECTFSSCHHNRILVNGQRIRKVICPEVPLSIRMEEESGQVFVHALPDAPERVTLSVITNSGLVQDLEISFGERSSEVVVLTDPKEEKTVSNARSAKGFLAFSNLIFAGRLPEGYRYLPVKHVQFCLSDGGIARLVARLEGESDYILVYQIINRSCQWQGVRECELSCIGSQWVCLESNRIPPSSRIMGLVSVRKP